MGRNLDLVRRWYTDFDAGYIDPVVAIYAKNATLTVGAGDSAGVVPYGGHFVGTDQIRNYYAWRFSMRTVKGAAGIIRPFCGIAAGGFEQEFGPWVIIGGRITDTHTDTSPIYNGPFLHVWAFDSTGHVTSLSMFFAVP
jgi:hypothetical protein